MFYFARTARCPISLCWAAGDQGEGDEATHLGKPGGEGREGVLQSDRRRTGARNNCARSIFHAAHRLEEEPTHTTHTHKSSPAQPYRSGAGQSRDGGPAGRELVPGQDTAFSGLFRPGMPNPP